MKRAFNPVVFVDGVIRELERWPTDGPFTDARKAEILKALATAEAVVVLEEWIGLVTPSVRAMIAFPDRIVRLISSIEEELWLRLDDRTQIHDLPPRALQ